MVALKRRVNIYQKQGHWLGAFDAMASPCEILLSTESKQLALELTTIAAKEAWRIEQKYSRYRQDGIVALINTSNGKPVNVDPETSQLLDFSYQCYALSDGLFDITSGVLRKIWTFNGDDQLPIQASIDALLPLIGLDKTHWNNEGDEEKSSNSNTRQFSLPAGMEIDFGGIGKEYAVDRALQLIQQHKPNIAALVNFGGDIACNQPQSNNHSWRVGIEKVVNNSNHSSNKNTEESLEISQGALATSGDARRFLLHKGKRYSHILNPKTGWPIEQAPRSVTVAAPTCTQAGMMATLAMLQGAGAEEFLEQQQFQHWLIR